MAALTYGLWCFRQGRAQHSQYMMRARIAAQGFTVFAILGGFFLGAGSSTSANNTPTMGSSEPQSQSSKQAK